MIADLKKKSIDNKKKTRIVITTWPRSLSRRAVPFKAKGAEKRRRAHSDKNHL